MVNKVLIGLFIGLISLSASAASLIGDVLTPTGAVVPDRITLTVDGLAGPSCTMTQTLNPVKFVCDLSSLTQGKTYTLVATSVKDPVCTNGTNSGTCTSGGSAASAPFAYTWTPGFTQAPVNLQLKL